MLCCFVVLGSGLHGEGIMISQAFQLLTPTSPNFLADDVAYPPPVSNQEPNLSSLITAYPAPLNSTISTTSKFENIVLPKDRIVAVTNDGDVIDFNHDNSKFTGQIISTNKSIFILPTIPKDRTIITPMSIIGGDDRFKIHDTKAFPWTTVVKIEGHFIQNEVFTCTGWMLGRVLWLLLVIVSMTLVGQTSMLST